ncbi:anthrone oxygenase family protein [Marinivivus vitaminiproducens]|uniref:anthrone oxygenase family protein n=1 Tax=Marinivivus vitaminiproducens TaxID=3035935 RepID=UPI0027A5D13C|nr:DUF1772 domain-containing protein [Geminicoccaceae bacterium SCSIO 64248]
MNGAITVLNVLALVGSGLSAGIFFVFSAEIMVGLRRIPVHDAIAAMQAFTKAALGPVYFGVLVSTGLVAMALVGMSMFADPDPREWLCIAGALVYFLSVGVSLNVHGPMNDALAGWRAEDPECARSWPGFQARWTRWNHVRLVAALGAMLLFILALIATPPAEALA